MTRQWDAAPIRSRPRPPAAGSPLDPALPAEHARFLAERPPGADEDVHMLAALVRHVVERCSSPGDLVFDPFAGFGATLSGAAALGRRAIGIELLPERVALLRAREPGATVLEGDARELGRLLAERAPEAADGGVDLVLTSPPYMTATDHAADPLTGYEEDTGDYERYLAQLGLVAAQCARAVAPGGYVVWNVADIRHAGHTTPLIRDCARLLSRHLTLVGVTAVGWDRLPHDLAADALIVCRRAPAPHTP